MTMGLLRCCGWLIHGRIAHCLMPLRPASWCRYFLQPKAAVMAQLEETVRGSDAELKKLGSSREALVKATESLRGELTEIISSLRRS
jgi:hypothetical protein